jgi:hypothetical protein
VSRESSAEQSRRDRLQARCERERNALIGVTATTLALLPRARQLSRWLRGTSRLLRAVARGMREPDSRTEGR